MFDLIEKIKKELSSRIEEDRASLAHNVCTNMHDYGLWCGRIQTREHDLAIIEEFYEEYLKRENYN